VEAHRTGKIDDLQCGDDMNLPIDVDYMGRAALSRMNAQRLRELKRPVVVSGSPNEPPCVVLVPYALYLQWQKILESEVTHP